MKKPTPMFWVAGVLFLLWNAFGCAMYVIDKTTSDEQYAQMYGEAMAATRDIYPLWATVGYAAGVWGGLIAAIFLWLRKRHAAPLFIASLLGAIVSFIPVFIDPAFKAAAGGTYWVMPVIVMLIGLLEIWWTRRKIADGTVG